MDKRLEKIRHFKANVLDFESYINDKIEQTKKESLNESLCDVFGFTPTESIPQECIDYVISNIEDFEMRYDLALKRINQIRCSLSFADSSLYDEIVDKVMEWRNDNDIQDENLEDIEEIFG